MERWRFDRISVRSESLGHSISYEGGPRLFDHFRGHPYAPIAYHGLPWQFDQDQTLVRAELRHRQRPSGDEALMDDDFFGVPRRSLN